MPQGSTGPMPISESTRGAAAQRPGQDRAAPPATRTHDEHPPTEGKHDRRLSFVLGVIVTCQLMVAVDSNVVTIALPENQSGLGMPGPALAWVFSAYWLAYGGLLLLGGRAGDLLGRHRMFIWGLGLVVAASILGGVAPDDSLLIAARALQGVGFAFASPAALSIIAATFAEGPERTRPHARVLSMITGFGITLGLILGGILTTRSWRLVYFINVPIGVLTIVLALRYLTETDCHTGAFDLLGADSVHARHSRRRLRADPRVRRLGRAGHRGADRHRHRAHRGVRLHRTARRSPDHAVAAARRSGSGRCLPDIRPTDGRHGRHLTIRRKCSFLTRPQTFGVNADSAAEAASR